jgi:hypothetical protein
MPWGGTNAGANRLTAIDQRMVDSQMIQRAE